MKKQQNSDFGETYSQRQIAAMARWEKLKTEGKWFWIFKRGAIWTVTVLLLYSLGVFLFPAQFLFQRTHFYLLIGMIAASVFVSLSEWSKMEAAYQIKKKIK